MRRVLIIVGLVMVLVGGVWLLQGVGILPGSFMTGDPFWAQAGLGILAVGVVICALGVRLGSGGKRGR